MNFPNLLADNQLNNREYATLLWIAVFIGWMIKFNRVRSSFGNTLRTAASWKIWIPFLGFLAETAVLVLLAHRLHFWNNQLIKATAIWMFGPAIVLFFGFADIGKKPHFFRRALIATLSYTVLLEFFMNLYVFSFKVEFFFVPLVTILVFMSFVAGMKQETVAAKRFIDTFIALTGGLLFLYVIVKVVANWHQIDKLREIRELALPVWLSIGALPFVYLLSLAANYELAFMRIKFRVDDRRVRHKIELALVSALHVRTHAVANFGGAVLMEITATSTFAEARQVIKKWRQSVNSTRLPAEQKE